MDGVMADDREIGDEHAREHRVGRLGGKTIGKDCAGDACAVDQQRHGKDHARKDHTAPHERCEHGLVEMAGSLAPSPSVLISPCPELKKSRMPAPAVIVSDLLTWRPGSEHQDKYGRGRSSREAGAPDDPTNISAP